MGLWHAGMVGDYDLLGEASAENPCRNFLLTIVNLRDVQVPDDLRPIRPNLLPSNPRVNPAPKNPQKAGFLLIQITPVSKNPNLLGRRWHRYPPDLIFGQVGLQINLWHCGR